MIPGVYIQSQPGSEFHHCRPKELLALSLTHHSDALHLTIHGTQLLCNQGNKYHHRAKQKTFFPYIYLPRLFDGTLQHAKLSIVYIYHKARYEFSSLLIIPSMRVLNTPKSLLACVVVLASGPFTRQLMLTNYFVTSCSASFDLSVSARKSNCPLNSLSPIYWCILYAPAFFTYFVIT